MAKQRSPVIFGREMKRRSVPAFYKCWRLYNVEVRSREGTLWEAVLIGSSVTRFGDSPQESVDNLLNELRKVQNIIAQFFRRAEPWLS